MDDLQEYLTPKSDTVYQANRLFFDETREILLFSGTIIDRLQEMKIQPASLTTAIQFFAYSFFRAHSNGIALWQLASSGRRSEARALARMMMEIFINVRYVARGEYDEVEQKAEEYFEHIEYQRLTHAKRAMKVATEHGYEKEADHFRRAGDQWKERVGDRRKTDYWPELSVPKRAEDAGCEMFYHAFYGDFSADVHFSSERLGEFWNGEKNTWSFGPKSAGPDGPLVVLYQVCLEVDLRLQDFCGHPFTFLDQVAPKTIDKLMEESTRLQGPNGGATA